MLTPEQRAEISRRNGARSRGPVSDAGKRRSSRNRLNHGRKARHHNEFVPRHSAVLCNEDRQAWFELFEDFRKHFNPASGVAMEYVRGLAEDQWLITRLNVIETAVFDRELFRKANATIDLFPEIREALHMLAAVDELAARPQILRLVGRLRHDRIRSRRENLHMLKQLQAHFPAPKEARQSNANEREFVLNEPCSNPVGTPFEPGSNHPKAA